MLVVRWRGGELDQLLDAAHARLGEDLVGLLTADGWTVVPDVSFSIYGERGSIDLLAWHQETRTLMVIELKSEIASVEETFRVARQLVDSLTTVSPARNREVEAARAKARAQQRFGGD